MESTHYHPDWRNEALCAFYGQQTGDYNLWFPEDEDGVDLHQQQVREAEAKAICNRCPVRAQCLRWVLDNPQSFGIFGGYSPDQRRKLGRQSNNEEIAMD